MAARSRFQITPGMVLRMLADAAMLQIALIAALVSRFYFAVAFQGIDSPEQVAAQARAYLSAYFHSAWSLTAICLVIFYAWGFYTYGRYYQGRYKLLVITQAVTLGFMAYGFLAFFFTASIQVPRGALLLAWGLALCMILGARIWTHVWAHLIHPEHERAMRRKGREGKTVLVIGGAGYIGSALVPKLLDRGYNVRVLDLMLFGEEPLRPYLDNPRLELLHGDFRHVENVVRAVQDVDAVVHLGGLVGDPACSLDEALTIDINLSATRMIAELAKAARVQRFVFASTCSVYGACDEVLDERSRVKPVSLYGHTKLASERVLRQMADERFAPTIVRFATIYGLSGRTRFDLVVNLLTAKAKIDGLITVQGGDQWRPFVHVSDAAESVALVLDAPKQLVANEIFNVGSNDQNRTIRQIGEMIHEQVVAAELVVHETDTDRRNYRVDFSKIRNLLGFEPKWTIEEGIQQVLGALARGEVTDYKQPQYSNVAYLTQQGTTSLARDRWARELLENLAGQ